MRSQAAFTLPERDLLTEGIAYDPGSGAFFVGSVHHRKIFRIGPRRAGSPNSSRRRATGYGPHWGCARIRPWRAVGRHGGGAADVGFDTVDCRTLGSVRLRPRDRRPARAVSPVAEGRNAPRARRRHARRAGDVYASDSRAPAIYRVRAGADTLERFLTSPLLLSAQGMALDRDERAMYVADYARGILRVDLASREVQLVPDRRTACWPSASTACTAWAATWSACRTV